ncbi:MAG: saccharopine dehydrogenase NADP-binding domain-containing protein [Nitrososphaerota archaeon]|nr:saccharopine dehydrogenase NADP-binding domain-containing protein [Nitrososphaerota archaeon]MDG7009391.1 saccharopine dehydrogenase NADP-binding domain-containing protein [Nitrososphaerota archaeon]MDG7019916.1 saccharopine dehydrogenase NADP-binding domain-containing protein [Nitrososphaerota archaeon]
MKAAVLGSGLMGSVIGWDLARSEGVDEVVVADVDEERLGALKKRSPGKKLSVELLDIREKGKVVSFLKRFDAAASALPHGIVHLSDLAAVQAGTKMVNIAFEDEQMELDEEARKTGATLVPGCGVAPGLGGILLTDALQELGGGDEGHILVGGIPQKPLPPYGYKLVFSIVGLLREYTDDARVFRGGKMVKVRPFDTVDTYEFPPPIGALEGFCTDGLASLVYTMNGMRVLDEITLRWPGHADKMKLLLESGYFSREKVRAGDVQVSPLEVSWEVLGKKLSEGEPKDITVMRVIAKGRKGSIIYDMVDRYDEANGVTSMGKTTAYTGSIVTQMLGKGEVQGKGVIPPEKAVTGKLVRTLLRELEQRGVQIRKER